MKKIEKLNLFDSEGRSPEELCTEERIVNKINEIIDYIEEEDILIKYGELGYNSISENDVELYKTVEDTSFSKEELEKEYGRGHKDGFLMGLSSAIGKFDLIEIDEKHKGAVIQVFVPKDLMEAIGCGGIFRKR